MLKLLYRGVGIGLFLSCCLIPFEWSILPSIGTILKAPLDGLCTSIGHTLFPACQDCIWALISDSHGLYLLVLTSLLLGLTLATAIYLFPRDWHRQLFDFIKVALLLYLGIQVAGYGVQKILMQQFFAPEANTLFTPIGRLEKDILFWSTMGASRSYCLFLGLMEIIPAILLLHYRTRLAGLVLLSMVMLHVLVINLSYDIDVKLYAALLLSISLYLLLPLLHGIRKKSHPELLIIKSEHLLTPSQWTNGLRPLLYLLLLAELTYPFYQATMKPGMQMISEEWVGAYTVDDASGRVQKVFFHSKGYLIMMYRNQELQDYRVMMNPDKHSLVLLEEEGQLQFTSMEFNQEITASGSIGTQSIHWQMRRLDLDELPLIRDKTELFVRE